MEEGHQADMAEVGKEIMDADRMTTTIKMVAVVATTTMARIVAEVQGATAEAAILLVETTPEAAMAAITITTTTTGKAEATIEVTAEVEVMTMTTGTTIIMMTLDREALSAEATIAMAIIIQGMAQATEEATSDQREVVVQWAGMEIVMIDRLVEVEGMESLLVAEVIV